ncbi:MAG: MFS transporter, partial [Verrucomicrobia bacterium]|nr:MFS transporter [Verrucomicrobiota bacterium]
MERLSAPAAPRSAAWKWWVCGLLLCASAINYMDRQTLANAAVRITTQFHLRQEQYGNLELVFGWGFAAGSIFFGWLADRWPLRWVYPLVLALWSATGFATGWVGSYSGLLLCRGLLGLFEAGHWPCAIKTTQQLLAPHDRSMGNSLVQGGASVGAFLTPLAMNFLLTPELGSWRPAFQIIGALGLVWIVVWLVMIRATDLTLNRLMVEPSGSSVGEGAVPPAPTTIRTDAEVGPPKPVESAPVNGCKPSSFWPVLCGRRMLVILVIIACINTCWQTLRAWLPKFLIEGRGYAEADALYFNSLFFIASDLGCLGAGVLTLWLGRRGWSVHGARRLVFFGAAALTALTTCVAFLPKGWLLLAVLLVIG